MDDFSFVQVNFLDGDGDVTWNARGTQRARKARHTCPTYPIIVKTTRWYKRDVQGGQLGQRGNDKGESQGGRPWPARQTLVDNDKHSITCFVHEINTCCRNGELKAVTERVVRE